MGNYVLLVNIFDTPSKFSDFISEKYKDGLRFISVVKLNGEFCKDQEFIVFEKFTPERKEY